MARVVEPADRAALEARTRRGFAARFGRDAAVCVSAPGRVNLIGEHTDYNDGLVLPLAIARRTAVAAARRDDRRVRVASALGDGASRGASGNEFENASENASEGASRNQ